MLGHSYNYLTPDEIREQFGTSVPPFQPEYSLLRQALVLWAFLYVNSYLIYIIFASITYKWFFTPDPETGKNQFVCSKSPELLNVSRLCHHRARWDRSLFKGQIAQEIFTSTWSLFIMSGMTMPVELLSMHGYGFVYHDVAEYGWLYLILSPMLFLVFTDSLIYWIHRWLHHPKFYWVSFFNQKYFCSLTHVFDSCTRCITTSSTPLLTRRSRSTHSTAMLRVFLITCSHWCSHSTTTCTLHRSSWSASGPSTSTIGLFQKL